MAQESEVGIEQRSIQDLPDALRELQGWAECVEALRSGQQATFDSVWGSACALLVAALKRSGLPRILLVQPSDRLLDHFLDDLRTLGPGLSADSDEFALFPACPDLALADLATDEQYGQRLRLLRRISDGQIPAVIASSIHGLMQTLPHPEIFAEQVWKLEVGRSLDPVAFRTWLSENGFQPTTAVELPGEFSSRGGILDVYPADAYKPFRIELFDTDIESIRVFDAATQRSTEKCQSIELRSLKNQSDAADHATATLLDYLPRDTVVLQLEPAEIRQHALELVQRNHAGDAFVDLSSIQRSWAAFPLATASRLAVGITGPACQLPVEALGKFSGELADVRYELERLAVEQQIFLLAATDGEVHRVREIFRETQAARTGRLTVTHGHLASGFRLRHIRTVVLGCDELFQRSDLRRSWRRRASRRVENFSQLKNGDLVVHVAHGIGRYRGLKVLNHDQQSRSAGKPPAPGHKSEHLEIEFAEGTRIYVPVNKIGLVQKYVGGTRTRPKLAKLGGKNWARHKQAAEEAVNDLAADMLQIQAVRASKTGIRCHEDTAWQYEFEHSFPYRETPDQLDAITTIKQDMESEKPMDRLLCGDVGFGKTEVAMRAAFKAVENGYQVGVLVPTTVLAEQHYKTFRERMAEYPISIARLSRFASAPQQREIVAAIAAGKAEIVIGTHRLASRDVQFKNLGLIIIDEEQRFGVSVKEKLKSLRAEVEVLTMSATPIPRTLHMSLVGVRDISNLTIAPDDRMPVATNVSRFDENLIREAILRELNRDGQIYFVHNRVNDILLIRNRLQTIVPEARIIVGHGQMAEGELEDAMTRFVAREFDVLLATTIIENGLDIPNANTILINNADRFGLSELHQLRGRVGRDKHRAYCYLLLDPNRHLPAVAAKRLQAIQHFSDMGAGFAIAMRDLEIRGAGNLLGTEQSGHIAAVGYEMYCQLLEAAVRQLKNMPAKISIDVDIDLPVEAWIPDDYISDRQQKVNFYRRLYELQAFDELVKLRTEMRDRFGPVPQPVKRLMRLAEIKLEAAVWQINAIFIQEERYLGFRFSDPGRITQFTKASRFPLRSVNNQVVYVTLKPELLASVRLLKLVQSILKAER